MVKPSERPEWIPVLHRYFQPVGGPGDNVTEYECVFGNTHDGKLLSEIVSDDPDWLEWILVEDFPDEVKTVVEAAIEKWVH